MAKNYVIGIGGTGARVVEAIVQCCVAGLGPDELGVFLVDADEGNGNLSQTKTLVSDYRACRARLPRRVAMPFCRTVIEAPDPEIVWTILTRQNQTLEDAIGMTDLRTNRPDLYDLVTLLFSDQELRTELNEGFRGHPSIGAAVMADLPQVNPWQTFWKDVAECGPGEMRVMLVGSVFGGTGAAGVPTFGSREVLKYAKPARASEGDEATSRIRLGAALVLPYFTFGAPPAGEIARSMFVTPADFPMATSAALRFYDVKKLAFDEIYVVGDSGKEGDASGPSVGAFSPGNVSQHNRPHYIELVTALAAFDFFDRGNGAAGESTRYFTAARQRVDLVDWAALPVTRVAQKIASLQAEVQLRLGTMATFAYALSTYGADVLTSSHADSQLHAWYKYLFPDRDEQPARSPRAGANREAIVACAALGRRFLKWADGLATDATVRLIDTATVTDDRSSGALKPPMAYPGNIGHLVAAGRSEAETFADFINKDLNGIRADDRTRPPSDLFIELFYAASEQFCRRNYHLEPAKG